MIRRPRSLFAWRVLYENHAWRLRVNTITGERLWTRKFTGGYIPIPMIDDEGNELPRGAPPAPRPVR